MTTATQDGRRLRLEVDGIDDPFFIEPLPARRGRLLTGMFLDAALGRAHPLEAQAIFIEAIGPANFVRLNGSFVDHYDEAGVYVDTTTPDGVTTHAAAPPRLPDGVPPGTRYLARDDGTIDGEPIRQEEGESLCIAAFYWQTVAGMEAVNEFIGGGEGSVGSLKALNVLTFRLGLSPSRTSRNSELESLIETDVISVMNTPNGGGTLAKLPANKRSHRRAANPANRRRRTG